MTNQKHISHRSISGEQGKENSEIENIQAEHQKHTVFLNSAHSQTCHSWFN